VGKGEKIEVKKRKKPETPPHWAYVTRYGAHNQWGGRRRSSREDGQGHNVSTDRAELVGVRVVGGGFKKDLRIVEPLGDYQKKERQRRLLLGGKPLCVRRARGLFAWSDSGVRVVENEMRKKRSGLGA